MDPLPKKNLKMRHWVGYAAVSRAQGPQSASYRPSVFAHANDRRELTKKKKNKNVENRYGKVAQLHWSHARFDRLSFKIDLLPTENAVFLDIYVRIARKSVRCQKVCLPVDGCATHDTANPDCFPNACVSFTPTFPLSLTRYFF